MRAFALVVCVLATLRPATAGEKKEFKFPAPGPEHKLLASLEGTFDAKVKSWFGPGEPTESTGVMKRQMILDGRYLQEHYDGKLLDKSFRGMAIVGFDARKKKYVNAWVDSLSTSIATMEGTYDQKTKTLTTFGEDYAPGTDKKMKSRDVLKIVDADTQLFEMYRQPEGESKEFKVLEITYRRRK
jgi:hypothetical protein